jgi:hypothetical protein
VTVERLKTETAERPTEAIGFPRALGFPAFVVLLAAVYVTMAPLEFSMPAYGLDESWTAVLGEASTHGWRFGRDIIFTSGPLSPIYTHWFQPDRFSAYLAADLILVVTFASIVFILGWRSDSLAGVFLAALGIVLYPFRDAIFVAYPLLTSLVILSPQRGALDKAAAALGLICCALATLAKFPVALAAILMFVLCDIAGIIRRRLPFYTAAYVLLCFGLFAMSEGPGSFAKYVVSSFNLASGYSEAMSLERAHQEIVAFLVVAAVLLAAFAFMEAQSARRSDIGRSIAAVRWLCMATYLFLMFKQGFVRHDEHSLRAWSALLIVALIYPLSFPRAGMVPTHVCLAVATWSAVAIPMVDPASLSFLTSLPARIEQQFALAAGFISDPGKQIAQWQRAKEEAWVRVRAVQQLPQINGSVDVIPSIQASVLAHGLDYRPRYNFQEYSTFTHHLIEENRRSLIERGPDFLLFQSISIDGRLPTAEGPLWPDILATFAPVSDDGKLVLMRRRNSPLNNLLRPETSQTVSFGERLAIPPGAQFAKIEIDETLFGRLVGVLFRPPLIRMRVMLTDGTEWFSRIIPGIAREGFLLTPVVITSRDFWRLAHGHADLQFPPVKQISFETSNLGRRVYTSRLRVSLSSLSLDELRHAAGESDESASSKAAQ